PAGDLDPGGGVVLAPAEGDRAGQTGELVGVLLVDDGDEHVAHHATCGAVVGGPVPLPGGVEHRLGNEAHPAEATDEAVRARWSPGGGEPEERHAEEHDAPDELGAGRSEMGGHPAA